MKLKLILTALKGFADIIDELVQRCNLDVLRDAIRLVYIALLIQSHLNVLW